MCENHTENVINGCEKCTTVPTWKERMQEEYRFVKGKYDKLHKMCIKAEAGTLDFTPNCSLDLLLEQKAAMGHYLHCLEIRAEIEGVEL